MFIVIYKIKGVSYISPAVSIKWIAELIAEDLVIDGLEAKVYEIKE